MGGNLTMKKIWVNRTTSFKKAEKFENKYYQKMSAQERLETIQILRENYFKITKGKKNARRERLRRVVKIIQQK